MSQPRHTKILVAEDDPLVAEMVISLLEKLGYTVIGQAFNGQQAVEMTHQLRPNLVLMDIAMPELNGIEAAGQIAELCPTPVVILSAFNAIEVVEDASMAGVGGYVVKPPRARELDRAITIALARFDDLMQLRRLNRELTETLQQIKTLSGLLPICTFCKKVRTDDGYWQQVEVYIQNRTEARFTHGLCQDCAKVMFPDIEF